MAEELAKEPEAALELHQRSAGGGRDQKQDELRNKDQGITLLPNKPTSGRWFVIGWQRQDQRKTTKEVECSVSMVIAESISINVLP